MAAEPRQALGLCGERLAQLFLEACGFSCLAVRYRKGEGELDLVMRKGSLVAFVEVKTRSTRRCGTPEEAVTRSKLYRMRRLARYFMQERQLPVGARYRFDVVAVDMEGEGRGCRLRHYAGIG